MNAKDEPEDVSLKLSLKLAAFHECLIRGSARSPLIPATETDYGAAAPELETPSPTTPLPELEPKNETLSPIRPQGLSGAEAPARNGTANGSDPSLDGEDEDIDLEDENLLADCMKCVELLDRVRRRALPVSLVDVTLDGDPDASDGDEADDLALELMPDRVGRYQILRRLGAGGLGIVFEAHDPQLNRSVALKVPRPDLLLSKSLRRRFVVEAEAASRLNHPNLVAVYDAGEEVPYLYIASEYCPGVNLAEWLAARTEPVPIQQAVTIVRQLADGVSHAHSRGILHRDIKPSNVLVSYGDRPYAEPASESLEDLHVRTHSEGPHTQPSPGGRGLSGGRGLLTPLANGGRGAGAEGETHFTVKLGDFGLAKLVDQEVEHTRSGQVLGTVAYMSPEQADGRSDELDVRADVYSLGIVLYELLTGTSPFGGRSGAATLAAVMSADPPVPRRLRGEIPRDLEAICLKAMSKSREDRYATAAELAADLGRFSEGRPTVALPATTAQRLAKWARRKPTLAALYSVVLASALVVIALYIRNDIQVRSLLTRERLAKTTAQHHMYATEMAQAQRYFNEGNIPLLRETLQRYIPQPEEPDLRTFPWYYLWHNLDRSEKTLVGHDGEVNSVHYSHDGTKLASAGADGTVRIWDPASGALLSTFAAHANGCNVVKFLASGRELISIGDDGKLSSIDGESQTPMRIVWESPVRLEALAVSKDGKLVAVGDKDGTVTILNPANWGVVNSWLAHPKKIHCLDFSPDGKLLLTAGNQGGATLWRAPVWEFVEHLSKTDTSISSAGFSPDGQYVRLTFKDDGVTDLLKFSRFEQRGPPSASPPFFRSIGMVDGTRPTLSQGISGDGKVVVGHSKAGIRSSDDRAFVWSEEDGFRSLKHEDHSQASGVSHDGSTVVGYVGLPPRAFMWSKSVGIQLLEDLPGGEVQSIARRISEDGKVIVGQSHSDRGYEPVRWVNGKVHSLIPRDGPHEGALYNAEAELVSADGATIAGRLARFNDTNESMFVWTEQDGLREIDIPNHDNVGVYSMSRDGECVGGRAKGSSLDGWIWTEETGVQFFSPTRQGDPYIQEVRCVAADASFLVGTYGTQTSTTFFLSAMKPTSYWGKGQCIRTWEEALADLGLGDVIPSGWNIQQIQGISADNRRMVGFGMSPAGKMESFLIDLPAEADLGPITGDRLTTKFVDSYQVSKLASYASAISQDSRSMITTDERGTININEIGGRQNAFLRGHTRRIWDLQTSPDAAQLASASADGTIKLWNLESAVIQQEFHYDDPTPTSYSWSPDSQRLAIGFDDGTIHFCDPEMRVVHTHRDKDSIRCESMGFSRDSKLLYVCGPIRKNREIRIFDVQSGNPIGTLGPDSVGARAIACISDGDTVAIDRISGVHLKDRKTKQGLRSISRIGIEPSAIAASPVEPKLAVAFDKWIELWDLQTHQKRLELTGHFRGIHCLAYSLDGRRLASSGDDQEIKIWDVASGDCLATLIAHAAPVCSLSWCAGGNTLGSTDESGHVYLWDLRTNQPMFSQRLNCRSTLNFSPDGQRLITLRSARTMQLEFYRTPIKSGHFRIPGS